MTLRVTLEIVPFGDEDNKKEIYRMDISNIGIVNDIGFGHVVCKYKVGLYGRVVELLRKPGGPEYELIDVDFVEEHNRRDGAVALVEKACKLMAEKA